MGTIECRTAAEGLAKHPIGDRHVADQDLVLPLGPARPDDVPRAQRDEFRKALHIGHEVEHAVGAVLDQSGRLEGRHRSPPLRLPQASMGFAKTHLIQINRPAARLRYDGFPPARAATWT